MAESLLLFQLLPLEFRPIPKLPQNSADCISLFIFVFLFLSVFSKGTLWARPNPYKYIYYERPQLKGGTAAEARKESRNIGIKLRDHDKDLVVLWGSQSGTGEVFAQRLARECSTRFGIKAVAVDLLDVDPQTLSAIAAEKIAIFILSTFGEGDPSDNASAFWTWLGQQKDSNLLNNLKYTVFGLGNSNYKYFNKVAQVFDSALSSFGADRMLPLGRADDAQGSTEEDFVTWKESLFSYFQDILGCKEQTSGFQPAFSITQDPSVSPSSLHMGAPYAPKQRIEVSPIPICSTRTLSRSNDRTYLHLELDLSVNAKLHYRTGEYVLLWPTNPPALVSQLVDLLDLSSQQDTPITVQSLDASVKLPVPTPTTIATLLTHYLELTAPVSRSTMRSLAAVAPTAEARDFLLETSHNQATHHHFLAAHPYTTFPSLLAHASAHHPWPRLPLASLLELLPPMHPRHYSIASSPAAHHPQTIALTLSLTHHPSNPHAIIGLAGSHLAALPSGTTIPAAIRPSVFRLPASTTHPIIMIATGSGIAPFRAFVAERARLATMRRPSIGKMLLFFGCRNHADRLYAEEFDAHAAALNTYAVEGQRVFEMVTAFSRPGELNKGKYVQDCVAERAGEMVRLLDEGATLYVCGGAAMARAVGKAVAGAYRDVRGWDEGTFAAWRDERRRVGRWREDVWG